MVFSPHPRDVSEATGRNALTGCNCVMYVKALGTKAPGATTCDVHTLDLSTLDTL